MADPTKEPSLEAGAEVELTQEQLEQASGGTAVDTGDLDQTMQMRVQDTMEMRAQVSRALSNVISSQEETSNAIIKNLR